MQRLRHQTLSFGDFTLDLSRGCLLRGVEEVKLRPKSFEVLRLLVENSDRLVSKAELMQTVWPDSFVTDDSLVQCLIEIRRALADDSHRYIKTVPRRGYIFHAEVVRHDLAQREVVYTEEVEGVSVTIEDDAHGLAPARDKVTGGPTPATGTAPPEHRRRTRTLVLIAVSLAIALAAVVLLISLRRKTQTQNQSPPVRSIAVLPLKNLTDNPANEYFSDGITESLITALSKIKGLKVISRGSVFRFKGRETDPREAGKVLGVEAVLEGSVRKDANSVRAVVRLVSVEDGHVLWTGDTYDHALGDIFALQDEIARSLAGGLRVKLSSEGESALAHRYTGDIEAYELYLKGRFFWNKRTEEGLQKSVEYFELAIARDPKYALAYAGLSDSYALLNLYGSAQQKDAFPQAKAAAEKALAIDETLAEAHNALAYVKEQYEWDWAGAEREYKRAIELDPNYATAYQYYSEYLALLGRTEESVAHIRRARELDPLSLIINTELGYPHFCARRWDEALGYYRKALEIDPSFHFAVFFAARCHVQKGEFDEAIAESRRAVALSGGSALTVAGLGYAYAAAGRKGEAREVLRDLTSRSGRRYVSSYLIATLYAGLGENDRALTWLEKAYEERDYLLVMLRIDPRLDGLRADPRFTDLLRRVGLASQATQG
ncbi:MAG: winged helix-turn-helix domain-containing protein [Pyrinomonadaceae bacterium]